jgi:hypothetical protein
MYVNLLLYFRIIKADMIKLNHQMLLQIKNDNGNGNIG